MECKIKINESNGIERHDEPITIGVPFKRGRLHPTDHLSLALGSTNCAVQFKPIAWWPDGSIKWALIDFQSSTKAGCTDHFNLSCANERFESKEYNGVRLLEKPNEIVVETGRGSFIVDRKCFRPFSRVTINGGLVSDATTAHMTLTDLGGNSFEPMIETIVSEMVGSLHTIIRFDGYFGTPQNPLVRWIANMHFYWQKEGVRLDFSLWNPRPAKHAGGLWDLGDPGSFLFKDLSLRTGIAGSKNTISFNWLVDGTGPIESSQSNNLKIYQGSSGGENYRSANHVNAQGKVPVEIKGFEVTADSACLKRGNRAMPLLHISDGKRSISIAMRQFWQNFPKALEAEGNTIVLRLFPGQYNDPYELQGGERKTHSFFISFNESLDASLASIHPLSWSIDPAYLQSTQAIPHLSIRTESEDPIYRELIDGIVQGETSFFERRELIDEYGWRHFGELYADHEAVGYQGEGRLVSHYNNQYDFIYGAARKFAACGDQRWYQLMDDLARHVRDIDIYHTDKDRHEYNGGFFWHTNHYLDAATCTHRSESKEHLKHADPRFCGGGPALEHNYTTGLMTHYYLTGEEASKEAVLSLADWVVTLMGRPHTVLAFLQWLKMHSRVWKRVFKGEAIRHYPYPFTRESGNSITALLDAHALTGKRQYLEKAEEVIRGCMHPNDDMDRRDLMNAELNWSYTACLQAIGKYLDYKTGLAETDAMFGYARACLLRYSHWMLINEKPYLDRRETLKFPNETWPAQDMRKSAVFYFAAKHAAKKDKSLFLDKACDYYTYAVHKVNEFETSSLTRPLVLLLQNAYLHHSFKEHPEQFSEATSSEQPDVAFGDNLLNRWRLSKMLLRVAAGRIWRFSLKSEIHWLRCRLNRHI